MRRRPDRGGSVAVAYAKFASRSGTSAETFDQPLADPEDRVALSKFTFDFVTVCRLAEVRQTS